MLSQPSTRRASQYPYRRPQDAQPEPRAPRRVTGTVAVTVTVTVPGTVTGTVTVPGTGTVTIAVPVPVPAEIFVQQFGIAVVPGHSRPIQFQVHAIRGHSSYIPIPGKVSAMQSEHDTQLLTPPFE